MPCTPRIARLLLKQGKARIYKHSYTGFLAIKLNYVPKKRYLQKNRIGVAVVRIDKNQGKIKLKKSLSQGKKKALKDATQMNYLKSLLVEHYPKAKITWGFITKENRQHLKLSKEHYNDALVIASKGKKVKFETNQVTMVVKVTKGDYQLSKGSHSEQRLPKGKIKGFRRFDKVRYFGKDYFIKGRRTSGTGELMNVEGNRIDFSYMPKGYKTPSMKNMVRLSSRRSLMIQNVSL